MDHSFHLQLHQSNSDRPTFLPQWLHSFFTAINIESYDIAILICKLIPAQCPFERDVVFLGHKLFHLPPLCKLNPAYGAMISLRFKALSYLEDQYGEQHSE